MIKQPQSTQNDFMENQRLRDWQVLCAQGSLTLPNWLHSCKCVIAPCVLIDGRANIGSVCVCK